MTIDSSKFWSYGYGYNPLINSGYYPTYTRADILTPDFILQEWSSPMRRSRKIFPAIAGVKIGDFIQIDGTPLQVKTVADAAKIAGISLTTVPAHMAGLTREGDIKVAAITRYAILKAFFRTLYENEYKQADKAVSDAITAQLAKMGISFEGSAY